jgi:hypothetical protein
MLKLEKEEGLRVDTQSVAGRTTLSVVHVRDLMLTNKTRVFKAALIAQEDGQLVAWACDEQRQTGDYLAEFFLSRFLGVKLVAKPEVLTRDFMDAAESWIANEIQDPETKVRYHVALMAEMNSNRATITPNAFANEHLDAFERELFLAHIADKGALTKRFPKNIQLVQNRLRKIQFNLSGQISLICPPDAVGENVRITTDTNDGMALIWAKGELEGVKGRVR